MFCLYTNLDSFPRIAGAIPLPSPALYLALGQRSPPCLISALRLVTRALSLAQCQGWRRLCKKNSAGAARQIAPAKSGGESKRGRRNSAGDARKRAPANCERQRRGSTQGGTGKRNRNRWRSALRRRNPPPCAGSILLPSPVLSPPCAGALPALRQSTTLRRLYPPPFAGALFCAVSGYRLSTNIRSRHMPGTNIRLPPGFFAR